MSEDLEGFGPIHRHGRTHQNAGRDAIRLDDLAATEDNTDLNSSTTAHGLLAKLSGTAADFLGGDGAFKSATTARSNMGLATSDSPQFAAVNIGDASDTTVSRASAGNLAIEGNLVYRAGGTDVPVADGGTGASNAADARTNLGLVIGTDVQAWDADLDSYAIATQADMEAASSTNNTVTPGRVHFHPGVAKAWIFFDGTVVTPALVTGYNFDSTITDNGTGDYTCTMTTDMSSGDHAPLVSGAREFQYFASKAAGSVRVRSGDNAGTLQDDPYIMIAVFGDI